MTTTGLSGALGVRSGDVVAVAGAGGKTTLCYRLAREATGEGRRVVVTTTTHMGLLPEDVTGPVFVEDEGPATGLEEALRVHGRATLLGRRLRPDKLEGVPPERVDALARVADLVVVEADGARGRSLKVPAPHEPVVPASSTLLVVVAALDVLGRPLAEQDVHRLELVLAATGRRAGEPVDEDVLADALLHPAGYLARVRPGLRTVVFLNKAEDASRLEAAERLAARLLPSYDRVVAGSARGGPLRCCP